MLKCNCCLLIAVADKQSTDIAIQPEQLVANTKFAAAVKKSKSAPATGPSRLIDYHLRICEIWSLKLPFYIATITENRERARFTLSDRLIGMTLGTIAAPSGCIRFVIQAPCSRAKVFKPPAEADTNLLTPKG